MAKKRPRARKSTRPLPRRASPSRIDPGYWARRLFQNTFTYRGRRFQVSHWSVKIQYQGARRTFSLQAANRKKAASEACAIYTKLITCGWESLGGHDLREPAVSRIEGHAVGARTRRASLPGYWAERLIHRKYTEQLHPNAHRELSVRIDHAGTSHYFPLGTCHRKIAVRHAARIYQTVASEGWHVAGERFPRELSVALRWADDPVAWTYFTIHTLPLQRWRPAAKYPAARLTVAIAETDAGLRHALASAINQQPGCHCVASFSGTLETLREIPRQPLQLLLISQSLMSETSGPAFLEEVKVVAPKLTPVVFSAYEDADQLFKSAPGGAGGYLFRRTAPNCILEPLIQSLDQVIPGPESTATSIRNYFAQSISSLPVGGSVHQLANLTPREHEILALLSKGHPDKEIADLLRISTWTVHGHLKKIFEKLGAHNRTDAVVKYLHK